jgi:hypothetical protein
MIAALKRYLKLAPASPQARFVRRELKSLQPTPVSPPKHKSGHK